MESMSKRSESEVSSGVDMQESSAKRARLASDCDSQQHQKPQLVQERQAQGEQEQSMQEKQRNIVRAGETVLLREHDNHWYFGIVGKQHTIRVGKVTIKTEMLVGRRFGEFFEIRDRNTISFFTEVPFTERIGVVEMEDINANADNRNIQAVLEHHDAEVQKPVMLMAQGFSGEDLVKKLVESRAMKDQRTVFEQEKFKKRKASKYTTILQILQPTPSAICRMYSTKRLDRIGMLREDTIGLVLNRANITSGMQALIVEQGTMHVLAGAVAYRLQGAGRVLRGFTEDRFLSDYSLVRTMNQDVLASGSRAPVYSFCMQDILEVLRARNPAELLQGEQMPKFRRSAMTPSRERVLSFLRSGVDSLIIAAGVESTMDIRTLFACLWPLLAPGAPFVIYSHSLQPLDELFDTVRCSYRFDRSPGSVSENKLSEKTPIAVHTLLTEEFSRLYQVLPDRSHPEMGLQLPSGYILSGYKVQPSTDEFENCTATCIQEARSVPPPLQQFWKMTTTVPISEIVPLTFDDSDEPVGPYVPSQEYLDYAIQCEEAAKAADPRFKSEAAARDASLS
eukprot:ANDGO_05413.mRNA.1 tRNA (adenine(58)-N(1))-methyltransferase non-catalytic subunit trm6